MSDIVKQGYVKIKSKNIGMWNKRWLVLRRAPPRLEKYETEAAASGVQGSFHCVRYDLNQAEVINRTADKPGIYLMIADSTSLQIATDSNCDAEAWMTAIERTLQGLDDTPTSGPELFEVYLMRSAQLKSSGECLLQVTDECVQLLDINNKRRVQLSWPLSFIRRYSIERGMFSLEAGRKCESGEGLFMFECKTGEADLIFERVQKATRNLAGRNDPTTPDVHDW